MTRGEALQYDAFGPPSMTRRHPLASFFSARVRHFVAALGATVVACVRHQWALGKSSQVHAICQGGAKWSGCMEARLSLVSLIEMASSEGEAPELKHQTDVPNAFFSHVPTPDFLSGGIDG